MFLKRKIEKYNINLIVYFISIFLLCSMFLLYKTPAPSFFFGDPDGGEFITGGHQLLVTGEQPQIDFLDSYGPLSYQLRAISQYIFGTGIASEIILVVIGYSLSLTFLFLALRIGSGSLPISLILLCLAFLSLPKYYKFFVVLIPAVILFQSFMYARSPSKFSAFLLGIFIGISYLFRHDYAVFAFATAMVAILVAWNKSLSRFWQVFYLGVGSFVMLAPWFFLIGMKGSYRGYFSEIFYTTVNYSGGLGLPNPIFHWSNPLISICFTISYAIPLLLIFLSFHQKKHFDQSLHSDIAIASVSSVFFLIQSMHRSDFQHLLQSLPAPIIALGVLWRCSRHAYQKWVRTITTALFFLIFIILTFESYWVSRYSYSPIIQAYKNFRSSISLNRMGVVQWVERKDPENPDVALIRIIKSCTTQKERIVIYPYRPQIAFFSNRLMGGGAFGIGPGYLDDPLSQRKIVQNLKQNPPILIFWNEKFLYDNDPKKNPIYVQHTIYSFVKRSYHLIKNVSDYNVYILNGSIISQNGNEKNCILIQK